MESNLEGQVALVTGGAVRIGAAISLALARAGADVVIHCRRSRAAAERLAARIRKSGRRAFVVEGDLCGERACRQILSRTLKLAGDLHILINNAAVFNKHALEKFTERDLVAEFETNFFAPMILMREFAVRVGEGVIVNLLDRRIKGWDATCAPYVFSKKALAEATRMAALRWAPNIRVNAVAPGAVLPPPGRGRHYLRDHAGPIPLRLQVQPENVADAVVYLAQARAVTGQILFVDGGQALLG